MKLLQKKFFIGLIGLIVIFLAGCSKPQPKKENTLPSAKTILTQAQKTKFKSMHARWTENIKNKTVQDAEVEYVTNPTVVHADVSSTSNHYKMWIEGKNNYIQMKGTSTNHWFKTKMGKNSSYAVITDNLNSMLLPFIQIAKLFKVEKNGNNYALTYKGNSKRMWKAIVSDSAITSLIGIDLDSVKPINNDIQIDVDKNFNINDVKVGATYHDDGQKKTFTMNADQIGEIKKLAVPKSVKKNAVDLGKMQK